MTTLVCPITLDGPFHTPESCHIGWHNPDVTLPLILWGSTELLVCILCASIPTLRPLYKTIRGTSSSHDIYELGNTPSRALENGSTIQGKSAYLSRSASRPFGGTSATGMSTMVSMGQQHENSSDEEILRDIKGRMDTTNSGKEEQIYRTTQVDITYSTGIWWEQQVVELYTKPPEIPALCRL